MNDTIFVIGALVVLALVGLLLWKFDVVKFATKLPGGIEVSGEGTRATSGTAPAATSVQREPLASGAGAVAVGEGAEQAEITTDVTGPAAAAPGSAGTGASVEASGAGSVAIGGGAKGAKIRTSVGRSGGEGV